MRTQDTPAFESHPMAFNERLNPIYDDQEEINEYYEDLSRNARMDTIYESYEEFGDSSDEKSNELSSTDGTSSARVSADSPKSVLRRSVRAWCDATGLPTTVLVETKQGSFRLHKFPLMSRSMYFKHMLAETTHVRLPDNFPGGSETFEMIAGFCYDSHVHINTRNVAALRCSAGYLEMTEDCGNHGNLTELTESYLVETVLRSWPETVTVLLHCYGLLPFSEEFQIVSRCIDSLADKLQCIRRAEGVVKDVVQLPLTFFHRLVSALRKRGGDEQLVTLLVMEYATTWIFENEAVTSGDWGKLSMLETIVKLLPLGVHKGERYMVPLKVLFMLHGFANVWEASMECITELQTRIASQLELATVEDFLVNRIQHKVHIDSMYRIVSMFMSQQQLILDGQEMLTNTSMLLAVSSVAKVWDEYLTEIASEPDISPKRFYELTEVIPSHVRATHDQLYKAIHVYFKSHATLSQSERLVVCKGLNCQKLSQEVCMHAVQNEHMPLRMIVQAMFMQQLQTRPHTSTTMHASSVHLTSPPATSSRVTSSTIDSGLFSGTSGTSGYLDLNSNASSTASWHLDRKKQEDGLPLGVILQRDAAFREASFLKDDFEATKARLRELEEELMRMKRTMQDVDVRKPDEYRCSTTTSTFMAGKGRKRFQNNCMCQIWGAQTSGIRLGQRITKTFQKLGLGGFWRPRPSPDVRKSDGLSVRNRDTDGSFVRTSDRDTDELEYSTPLRASSFRRMEEEQHSGARWHVRHHSFS